MDERSRSIIMQNAMSHAVNILVNNAKGKEIKLATVLQAAEIIADKVQEYATQGK